MVEVAGYELPFTLDSGFAVSSITIFILIFVFAVIMALLTYFVVIMLRYKYKIIIFENISGQGYQPSRRDKAMLVKVGEGGSEVLYLKQKKEYVSAYGKKMGKNTYWFVKGDDGYLYNVTAKDFHHDIKTGEIILEPADRDMRYMSVAIGRNLKERLDKTGFWAKYGGLVAYITLIAVTGIFTWLMFDKYLDIANTVNQAVQTADQVLQTSKELLGTAGNLKGSGIIPAE